MLPGRTLSASDSLWSAAPWSASAPAGVEQPWGSNFEQRDAVTQFQPFMQYTRRQLPGAPLWNPHVMSGRPYLADLVSAVYSPFSLPAYVLPFWSSLAVIAALRLFVAALGGYLLGRALGMRFAGGLMAGLVYGFSLFAVTWVSWPRWSVFALLPWLLLLAERVIKRPGPLPAVALAAVVAAQFLAGMPEASAAVLIATVAYFAWRLAGRGSRGRRARPALAFGLAILGGTALAAFVLVPFFELLFNSYDYDLRGSLAVQHVAPAYLLGAFLPDYWGRLPHTAQPFVGTLLVDRTLYMGALPLMLAAVALLRPSRERVAAGLVAVLALALVFGFGPLTWVSARLPILETMKVNYLLVWFALPMALLAGWGLDELTRDDGTRFGAGGWCWASPPPWWPLPSPGWA